MKKAKKKPAAKPATGKPKATPKKPTASKTTPKKQQKARGRKVEKVEEEYPHFRYYKKSGHPALIVGEQIGGNQEEEYKYRKVMHGGKDGRHNNETVYPNPNPADKDPMHISRRVRHDKKKKFNKKLPWKYPKK